jgi:hypothetical protein
MAAFATDEAASLYDDAQQPGVTAHSVGVNLVLRTSVIAHCPKRADLAICGRRSGFPMTTARYSHYKALR